jgi:hypothetical protein
MKLAFVLGAGASKDYAYPLGSEIKADLLSQLKPTLPTFKGLLGAGNSAEEINRFSLSLERADYDTIDQFVAAQHRNPAMQRIARQAIALCISRHENNANLFNVGPRWYKRLIEFLRSRPELLRRESFSIFTFNYDRSLEHYLHETVSLGGGGFSEHFLKEFFHDNIIHLHGAVGYLPWQMMPPGTAARDYGTAMDPGSVKAAGENILTPEQNAILGEEHQKRLMDADIVVMMGFGFHQQNMDKIRFEELANRPGKRVLVTVRALDTVKRDLLKSLLSVTTYEMDCASMMNILIEEMPKKPDPATSPGFT